MATPFSLFKRRSKDRKSGKIVTRICVRFRDEEGNVLKSATLKATTMSGAALEAKKLQDEGKGAVGANPLVLDFLKSFWSLDSDYMKLRERQGRGISTQYVKICGLIIAKHLGGRLKGVRLQSLTIQKMEKIILEMGDEGIGPRTINTVIQALHVPVANWARQNRMPDPLQYLPKMKESPRERGTLSLDEIKAVIAIPDENPRVIAGILLGALCGLRLGEARGLQWGDVDGETLHVVHNIVDDTEGLKRPKCGSSRDVPLPGPVAEALDLCKRTTPYVPTYVLHNDKRTDLPCSKKMLQDGLARVLRRIGVDDEAQIQRNLCFHGLRHSFVSLSRASGLPDFVVQRLAGHKSASMMERYSHADKVVDFGEAREKMAEALAPRPAKAGGAS